MLSHRSGLVLSVTLLAACNGSREVTTGCGRGAQCVLRPTLVVTGQVRASLNPLAGAFVDLTAYRNGCSGTAVTLLPSPAEARTDSAGVYTMRLEPLEAVPAACLRVAYSDALFSDTNGVALHVPPAAPETVHVNVTGP
jgi:hypothetical protein